MTKLQDFLLRIDSVIPVFVEGLQSTANDVEVIQNCSRPFMHLFDDITRRLGSLSRKMISKVGGTSLRYRLCSKVNLPDHYHPLEVSTAVL